MITVIMREKNGIASGVPYHIHHLSVSRVFRFRIQF
jgi:hypothetical protein